MENFTKYLNLFTKIKNIPFKTLELSKTSDVYFIITIEDNKLVGNYSYGDSDEETVYFSYIYSFSSNSIELWTDCFDKELVNKVQSIIDSL